METEINSRWPVDADEDEDRILAESARRGSEEAVRRTLAAGIPVTILRSGRIVEIWPDGAERVVETVRR